MKIDCSCPSDYQKVFSTRSAAAAALRFNRRGLSGTSRLVVSTLTGLGLDATSVLEIGGGLGEIQVALIESGLVSTATNVELATNWEEAAEALLQSRGLSNRVTRLCGDFVDVVDTVPRADVVILNRVVCCYLDWRALLSGAGSRTERYLVITFPRSWFRGVVRIENLLHRMRGRSFRGFVHPPKAMIGMLVSSGFHLVADQRTPVWRMVILSANPG